MSTTTLSHNNPFGKLLLVLVVIFITLISLFNVLTPNIPTNSTYNLQEYSLTANEARIIEIVSGHAWQEHGDEVNKAIKCLSDNGTWKSFKTSGFVDDSGKNIPTNLWICKDNDDFFVVVTTPFIRDGGNYIARLVTAYRIAKDVFPLINDFIKYIAEKWGAYEISYIIQAGTQIFLSPR